MLISIIIPNYNHSNYLEKRIESILNQTFQDFELILLDDCSSDSSREILLFYMNHPKVSHCVFNEVNSGSTFQQWEKGIELAKGKYIWIAESDDWAEPDFLKYTISELEKNEKVGLVYVASKYVDSEGIIKFDNGTENTGISVHYSGKAFIADRFVLNNVVGNASAAVFRKKTYSAIKNKGYKKMTYCGDWFFYVMLCEISDVVYIQKTLNNYRVHTGNVSTNAMKNGKYFTEGLDVLHYIAHIEGIVVSPVTFGLWVKCYVQKNKKYQFSGLLQKEITTKLRQIDKRMKWWLMYWKMRLVLKSLFK